MNIRDLAAATELPERQIRFLIAEGFVPPPRNGRAHADYDDEHLVAIRRYQRLRDLGFPPAAIRLLFAGEALTPLPVVPGVELRLDPALAGSGADIEPIVERVRALLADFTRETPHADRDRRET